MLCCWALLPAAEAPGALGKTRVACTQLGNAPHRDRKNVAARSWAGTQHACKQLLARRVLTTYERLHARGSALLPAKAPCLGSGPVLNTSTSRTSGLEAAAAAGAWPRESVSQWNTLAGSRAAAGAGTACACAAAALSSAASTSGSRAAAQRTILPAREGSGRHAVSEAVTEWHRGTSYSALVEKPRATALSLQANASQALKLPAASNTC